MPNDTSSSSEDPFDSLLSLEDQYYTEGYNQGHADGLRQARLEGRVFGFEQGFSKFIALGKLQAKARIWEARLHQSSHSLLSAETTTQEHNALPRLSPLAHNVNHERLRKQLDVLLALVNPQSVSTANTDEALDEFDNRLKRAQAKVKVIEKMIGEEQSPETKRGLRTGARTTNGDIEAFGGV